MHPKRALLTLAVVIALGLIGSALGAPQSGVTNSTATSSVASTSPARTFAPLATSSLISTTTVARDPVIRVVDGDTVIVAISGATTTLRLIGIDTPETVDPRKPVECFGEAASQEAHRLLDGTKVVIEYDASQGQRDVYGRTLAYIYMEDGTQFNDYMVANGYAHEYTYRLPYRYQAEFKAAEAAARSAKLGLWADAACAAESSRS